MKAIPLCFDGLLWPDPVTKWPRNFLHIQENCCHFSTRMYIRIHTIYSIYIYTLLPDFFCTWDDDASKCPIYFQTKAEKQPRGVLRVDVLIHIPTFLVSPSYLVNLVIYPYRYQPMHGCEWLHPGDWAETQFQVIDTRRLGTSECPAHLIGSWLNMNILDPSFERWLYRMISVDIP